MIEKQVKLDLETTNQLVFSKINNDTLLFIATILMVVSYFYNLPVLKYGIVGDNELRLYDIAGFFLLYKHFMYGSLIKGVIKKIMPYRWFWRFFSWAGISLVFTLLTGVFFAKYFYFLQTILYFYHLYVFFISGVFLYILCIKKNRINFFINLILFFSIIASLIVILQNFEVIPFLWNDTYKENYSGFLTGTFGPNKIVLGITSLLMFIFSASVFLEKKIKINPILNILAMIFSFYVIAISGSRTAYIGILVFVCYFAFFSFGKFVYFIIFFMSIAFTSFLVNNDFYTKAENVINNRVIKKARNKDDFKNANIGKLYEDLGAGRKGLSEQNFMFILENPIIIPFGMGFNNRLISSAGSSAHNMYLQIIKELGLVGFVLYFGWLVQFLFVNLNSFKGISIGLKGMVLSLMVTSFFGEQLYIYRALFGLLGLFCVLSSVFLAVLHKQHID